MTTDSGALLPGISVVVPVYNSEASLTLLVERLEPVLRASGGAYEAILVNDGSRDQSWAVVEALAAARPWVRGVCMMRNYGQHNAILCGIRDARMNVTVTIDDDLQHPPEEIPRLLEKMGEGFDVVYGTPDRQQHGLMRDLASLITKIAMQSAMGAETARQVSAFRAMRTAVLAASNDYRGAHTSLDVLLTWGTTRFTHVIVRHEPRATGKSNYTTRKLITHALNMMTGFSTLPLQFASVLGFTMTAFGVGVLAYVLIRYWIHGGSVAGFPFLASTIAIFSGAQMFALGVMGEYLARIHVRMLDRPSFAVRERVGGGGSATKGAVPDTHPVATLDPHG